MTEKCPKCGAPMVERQGRYGQFLGCSTFPNCRGTRPLAKSAPVAKKPLPKIAQFSTYQDKFFEFVEHGSGNGCLKAVAGSGKSTTLVFALERTPKNANVAYLAFNKHIADDLKSWDLPGNVHISTCHSLGYGNIWAAFGKTTVDNQKVYLIIKDLGQRMDPCDYDVVRDNLNTVIKLVSLCKGTMTDPTGENLVALATNYNIECNGDQAVIFDTVNKAFVASLEMTNMVDFDDMIYFCAGGMVPCKKFDFLFVDEAQDLNAAQIAMTLKSVTASGRILTVGDPFQSVYGFRGADVHAIENLIEATNAKELPLSITYRMPSSHVAYLKSLVPEYPIEAWEHAKEGTIETLSASQLVQVAQDGDMVLCRRNAPLVGYAFELLRQGIKAVILGRDIASNLTTIIGKVQKQGETGDDLNAFLRALDDYAQEQVLKLEHAGRTNQAQTLDDKCSTIMVIAENDCKNVQDILIKIDLIFSKDRQGVTFASVHKAKGLEAQRIFLLKPQELGSTSRCSNQDECDQERNIMIVALSRSKSALYFVSDEAQGKLW